MEKYAIYSYKLTERPFRNFDFPTQESSRINQLSLEKRFELLFGKERGAEVEGQSLRTARCCVASAT